MRAPRLLTVFRNDHLRRLAEDLVDGGRVGQERLGIFLNPGGLPVPVHGCDSHSRQDNQGQEENQDARRPFAGAFQVRPNGSRIRITPGRILRRATGDDAPRLRQQLGDDSPQGIDVGPAVHGSTGKQLGRRKGLRTTRLFQRGPVIGVSHPEIDDLQRSVVACDEEVGRFDVPVDDLVRMDIGQGSAELRNDPAARRRIRHSRLQDLGKRLAFNPFHLKIRPIFRRFTEGDHLAHAGVRQGGSDLELFPQARLVKGLPPKFWPQGLDSHETPFPDHAPDLAPSRFGTVHEHGRCIRDGITGPARAEKSGILLHTSAKIRFFAFICLCVLLFSRFTAHAQGAREKWDTVLDRYETVCDQCLSLRSRIVSGEAVKDKEVASLLKEWDRLRQTLQDASGSMSEIQRARFMTIRNRYAAALGTPDPKAAVPAVTPETPPGRHAPAATASSPGKAVAARQKPQTPSPEASSRPERTIPGRNPMPALAPPRALSVPLSCTGRTQPDPFPCRASAPAKSSIPQRADIDVLALAGLSRSRFSFGASLFYTPPRSCWGCFVSGRSNFVRTGSAYACNSSGALDAGGMFWGNGKDRYGIGVLNAGVSFHPAKNLALYAGTGYGKEELDWQDTAGQWARVSDWSRAGLSVEAGVLLHFGPVCISAGYGHIASPAFVAGCGIHF